MSTGDGVVQLGLQLRSSFIGKPFHEFLRIGKSLLRKRGQRLNAPSNIFGAIAIGVQLLVPKSMGFGHARGRELFGLADIFFPAVLDAAQRSLNGVVKLRRESDLNRLFGGKLELTLQRLQKLFGSDDDTFGLGWRALFFGGFIRSCSWRSGRPGNTVTSALPVVGTGLAVVERSGSSRRIVGWRHCRGTPRGRVVASEEALPVFGYGVDAPNISGSFQFDADLAEFARRLSSEDRANASAHGARVGSIGSRDLKSDPTFRRVFMARGIAAAVKIDGDRGCSFLENFAAAVGSKNDERNRPLDARAAAKLRILYRTMRLREWVRSHFFFILKSMISF